MVSGYFSIHMRWDFSLGGKSDSTVRLSGLNLCVCIHSKLGRTHRNCCHKHCTVIEDKRTRLTEQLKRMLRINLSLSSLSTPPCSEYQRSEIYFLCWDILCLRGLICPLGKYINLYLTQNVFLFCFVFLPWASKNSTVPRCPSEAAIIRGVRPCLSARLTSAPCVRSRSTIWKHPNTANILLYNWKSYSLTREWRRKRMRATYRIFTVCSRKQHVILMNPNQNRNIQLTCQCPCRTALNSGTMPLLLGWATAAPCSSNRRHTSSFPRPDAAVRAGHKNTQWINDEMRMRFTFSISSLLICWALFGVFVSIYWMLHDDSPTITLSQLCCRYLPAPEGNICLSSC